MIFWVSEPPRWREFIAWNDPAWGQVTGNARADVACNVKWLRSWGGVSYYISKYFTKIISEDEETGRVWGVVNRAVLPIDETEKIIPPAVGVPVQRCLRRLQEKKRRRWEYWCPSYARWRRVRMCKTFVTVEVTSFEHLLALYRSWGVRLRCRKAKVHYVKNVNVWAVDEETQKWQKVEGHEEKESCVSSAHFVASSEVDRLVAFYERAAARAAAVASIPF